MYRPLSVSSTSDVTITVATRVLLLSANAEKIIVNTSNPQRTLIFHFRPRATGTEKKQAMYVESQSF